MRWWDAAAILTLAAFFSAWFAPAVFGGRIFVEEDTAAYFFANRASLHALTHGAGFHWWDPLPGLGQPRLGNPQNGSLAPLSLLFYAFPTASVFRFHPALSLALLGVFTFGLFRARGVGTAPALFGALSFTTLGNVAAHVQHTAVIETILWWPATLFAWERWVETDRLRWLWAAALGVAFQCFGASPQYLLYGGLVMAVWIGSGLWERRADRPWLRRDLGALAAIGVVGIGLASWQLLPSLELVEHSHRSLLHEPQRFADLHRAAPWEVPLALAAEVFWWIEAPMRVHGPGYKNLPNLSLVALALASLAVVRRPRRLIEAVGALVFLVGMLGSVGGVPQLLGLVLPFADQLRAPVRMIVPAGFLLSWLAAWGLEHFPSLTPSRRNTLAILSIAWIAVLGWTTRRPDHNYVAASAFEVPEAIRSAQPRLAVDAARSKRLPLFAMNAGLAAGVPTLLLREVLIPANFFEAYFASQYGSLAQTRVLDRLIVLAALPLVDPGAPLMRAFDLRTVVTHDATGYRSTSIPGALGPVWLVPRVRVAETPEARWEAIGSSHWDPAVEAIVSESVRGLAGEEDAAAGEAAAAAAAGRYGAVQVVRNEPDEQVVDVESAGGILIASGLFFPGWQVHVDGESARPLEVDGALRGVALPPGRHQVEWRYRPTWLPAAWTATAVAVGVVITLSFVRARRSRST